MHRRVPSYPDYLLSEFDVIALDPDENIHWLDCYVYQDRVILNCPRRVTTVAIASVYLWGEFVPIETCILRHYGPEDLVLRGAIIENLITENLS